MKGRKSSIAMRFQAAALAICTPVVYAITLHTPSNLVIGQETTITWDYKSTDPNFTLFLMGTTGPFDLKQIIAEDLPASTGTITTTFNTDRVSSGVDYVLKAVNVTWVDFVYNTSPIFELSD